MGPRPVQPGVTAPHTDQRLMQLIDRLAIRREIVGARRKRRPYRVVTAGAVFLDCLRGGLEWQRPSL